MSEAEQYAADLQCLIVAILLENKELMDTGVVYSHCHRLASGSQTASLAAEISSEDVDSQLGTLEKAGVVLLHNLGSVVDDAIGPLPPPTPDLIFGANAIVSLGRNIDPFLRQNGPRIERIIKDVGITLQPTQWIDPIESVVPASDRLVTIGDNVRTSTATEAIELTLEKIDVSNTLGSEEKDLFRTTLELGVKLLKQPKAYLVAISGLLLKPLYDAYSSVIEETSKPAIQSAIDAVLAILG